MNSNVTDIIADRISNQIDEKNLVYSLAMGICNSDLQSLLIKVYEMKLGTMPIEKIISQYKNNRFVRACNIGQREMVNMDYLLYKLLPDSFEAIEFSPVVPFGTNNLLSKISQKMVMSAIRNVEVLSDPTTALAVECAIRRTEFLKNKITKCKKVRVATSHRSLRLQKFSEKLNFTSHFRTFALTTAGRGQGNAIFQSSSFLEHIGFYLQVLESLQERKYGIKNVIIEISDIRIAEEIIKRLALDRAFIGRHTTEDNFNFFDYCDVDLPGEGNSLSVLLYNKFKKYGVERFIASLQVFESNVVLELKKTFPNVSFTFNLKRIAGIGYYSDYCFKISAENSRGERYPLVDGGMVDWTQSLLGSNKERLLSSGVGTELLLKCFKSN